MLLTIANRIRVASTLLLQTPSASRLPVTARKCSSSATPAALKPIKEMSEHEQIRLIREDGIAPATGRPLKEIAAEIWNHNTNPVSAGHRSGLKILRKPLKGPLYASWYPESEAKNPHNPYRLTEKQERWKAKLKILRASGKGPPKKGAGKRSK